MSKLLKISEAATMAFHSMVLLAQDPEKMLTTKEMAEAIRASGNHLSKVLQRLNRAGLVLAERGPRGGFRLGRPAEEINLLQVYEAIEGQLHTTDCLLEIPVCGGTHCILGGLISELNYQVKSYLEKTRLADLHNVYPCAAAV